MKFLQYGTGCAGECSEVTESTVPYLLKVESLNSDSFHTWLNWVTLSRMILLVGLVVNKLKANRSHPRNYPHTPTDYWHSDKHLRLVMALICPLLQTVQPPEGGQTDRGEGGQTDGQTDGCYHFAVNNKNKLEWTGSPRICPYVCACHWLHSKKNNFSKWSRHLCSDG